MDIYSFFSGKIRNLVRNNLIEREQQLFSQSKGIHWGDEIVFFLMVRGKLEQLLLKN